MVIHDQQRLFRSAVCYQMLSLNSHQGEKTNSRWQRVPPGLDTCLWPDQEGKVREDKSPPEVHKVHNYAACSDSHTTRMRMFAQKHSRWWVKRLEDNEGLCNRMQLRLPFCVRAAEWIRTASFCTCRLLLWHLNLLVQEICAKKQQFLNIRAWCRRRVKFPYQMGAAFLPFIFNPIFLCHWISNMPLANWK